MPDSTPVAYRLFSWMRQGLLAGITNATGTGNTSERTIRDQARAVYRKSGVAGRTELSAFFLEDLLLPLQ